MQLGGIEYFLIFEEEEEKEEVKVEGFEKFDFTKNFFRKRKKVRVVLLLWVTVWQVLDINVFCKYLEVENNL